MGVYYFTKEKLTRIDAWVRPMQSQGLSFYFAVALVANLYLMFASGHESDLGYWTTWINQLKNKGYAGFVGDYPPMYIHWLWCCAKLIKIFDLDSGNQITVKFLSLFPVVMAHLILIRLAYYQLNKWQEEEKYKWALMWLVALNPVILLDGPMWGQVDTLPNLFIMFAIFAFWTKYYRYISLPLYLVALLTKFQMVAFLPVFAFLFFRDIKSSVVGIGISIPVVGFILLPFANAGNLSEVLQRAYVNTLGQYPYASMNAANFWMALFGNLWPDSYVVVTNKSLADVVTIKKIGMLIFFAISQWVFLRGFYLVAQGKRLKDELLQKYTWYAAIICSLGFFVFLPGMHERYVFSASMVSLCAAFRNKSFAKYAVLLAVSAAFNIILVTPIDGYMLWAPLAFFNMLIFLYLCLGDSKIMFFDHAWKKTKMALARTLIWPELALVVVFAYILYDMGRMPNIDESISENEVRLMDLEPISKAQDWGSLTKNSTIDGEPFETASGKFQFGLGTHADSLIKYELNKKYKIFRFGFGLNKDKRDSTLEYIVMGDQKIIWRSGLINSRNKADEISINVEYFNTLTLKVDSKGDNYQDHANWLNPVLLNK
jgi:Gpi18-like mannosyltransferase